MKAAEAGLVISAKETTRTFGYDQYGQLTTAATAKPDTTPELTLDYTYDPIGNRQQVGRTVPGEPKETTDYETNAVNQYTRIDYSLPATHYSLPEYDPNGNATAIDGQVLTWNEENRLATSTDGFRTTMYLYDGLGRRVEKSEYEAAVLKTTTRYVYDGWRVVEELDLSLGTSALSLIRRYTRGLDLSGSLGGAGGIGGLLAITLQPSVTGEFTPVSASYLYDGNGNVTGLLGDNGAELARYRYDPFGQRLSATGAWADLNPYQYSSKERDASTGFYYFGYRYYSPTTGRWLSRDPLEEAGGLNLYGHVGNDPLNRCDPRGLSFWGSVGRGLVIGFAIVAAVTVVLAALPGAAAAFIVAGLSAIALPLTAYMVAEAIGKYRDPCLTKEQKLDYFGEQLGMLIGGLGAARLAGVFGSIGNFIGRSIGAACLPEAAMEARALANVRASQAAAEEALAAAKAERAALAAEETALGTESATVAAREAVATAEAAVASNEAALAGERTVGNGWNASDFLKEVAFRAEQKIGGTGAVPGTNKHAYAADLIERYQRLYGNVGGGLATEQSYLAGSHLGRSVNLPGSVRLDVVEGALRNPSAVFDFKFTINPNPVLSPRRLADIRFNAGLSPSVPITPIHP